MLSCLVLVKTCLEFALGKCSFSPIEIVNILYLLKASSWLIETESVVSIAKHCADVC